MKHYSPLLLKYLQQFQEDPTSKVFAPLSEAYRKIGLLDEAIEICKEGLASNPDFIGGKVALARACYDKKNYVEVYETLKPHIEKIPDNLLAQRLYADSCLILGYLQEACISYKLILYFNPTDKEAAALVDELETQLYQTGGLLRGIRKPEKLRKIMKLQRLLNIVQKHKERKSEQFQ